jgi:3-phosphoshikimate 1-carboxyvinyltransferase
LLARFGARVSCEEDKVTVSPGELHGIDIDAANTPDLVPVLAAVASVAEGKTVIRNAGRLRIKESDRLHTVAASLSALGANITETEDGFIIQGQNILSGGETESFGDHRIAMTAAVLSAACSGHVVIKNAEAVNKSYPGFFEDFSAALGGVGEREG